MPGSNSSEADFSEGPGTDSRVNQQKKKERIRDNQRRSRARRQEHLADLEKRLAESHATVREAEMQRAAYREAQIENTRLRDLLRIAGVNESLTQSYINQGINQAQSADSSHRMIRPRIHTQREDRRSSESTRASPYPELLAISSMDIDPDLNLNSSRLSSASLASSYSPTRSPELPMPPHLLHGAHMQGLSIFKQASPRRSDDLYHRSGISPTAQWQDLRFKF